MSRQAEQPQGGLGAYLRHRQVQVEDQGFNMLPGERCQPSVGFDGNFDK